MSKHVKTLAFISVIACILFTILSFRNDASNASKEYKVISSKDVNTLQQSVTTSISFGWQPLGGLSNNGGIFYQAMIK